MLRVVFMGTPEIAVPTLIEIMGAGHEVVAAYCQPPRPAGRGMELRKSPVHLQAEGAGIPVFTPRNLKGEAEQAQFRAHEADVAVVIAYGLLLPKAILEAPHHGCLNMHGSALPRWRGAAPIQRAIMAGDTETAAMVMRMDEGLDTGPICLAEQIAIGPTMTAGELHDRMMHVGAGLMVRALAALERGTLVCTPQPADGVTYAAKIDKAESRIDFTRAAREVHNRIRGLSPFPGAWLEAGPEGKRERIKVLKSELAAGSGTPGTVLDPAGPIIACGEGAIRLAEVQRAGRKPMSGPELMRGFDLGRL
jgi:methionyl-tRNA formyltransferase